jgi:hypothetical protein
MLTPPRLLSESGSGSGLEMLPMRWYFPCVAVSRPHFRYEKEQCSLRRNRLMQTSRQKVSNEIGERLGTSDNLLRLSGGIENENDLIDDIVQAMKDKLPLE